MTMLDFYREHHISPVTQAIPDLPAHFARRAFLYREMGLPPIAITGKSVLEVGPGSGENARYIASLCPARYVLVEPNETARIALSETFPSAEIVSYEIETYQTEARFDVVLCEGLLGLSGRDSRTLLTKVGEKVAVGGVLVITCIDAISDCAEVLRRALAHRYIKNTATLQENVDILRPIFTPHLATLKGMTRSVDDWIVDNILNPASIGPTFSIPDALAHLEGRFEVLGCSPRCLVDWRWYKDSQIGNQWAIDSYWRNAHNLYDYRQIHPAREAEKNLALMRACEETRAEVAQLERGESVRVNTREVEADPGWFGRGQQYLSFVRVS